MKTYQFKVNKAMEEGDVMTKIKIIYEGKLICGFKMIGHSGFAKNGGPDILCASLSSISQMTVNGIIDFVNLDTHKIHVESDVKEGLLFFSLDYPLHRNDTVQQLFRSFILYVMQLEELYPQYVKLEGVVK